MRPARRTAVVAAARGWHSLPARPPASVGPFANGSAPTGTTDRRPISTSRDLSIVAFGSERKISQPSSGFRIRSRYTIVASRSCSCRRRKRRNSNRRNSLDGQNQRRARLSPEGSTHSRTASDSLDRPQETFAVSRISCSRTAAPSLFGRLGAPSLLAWNAFAIAAVLVETPRLFSMFWT
jgi:hypothetical protein